MLRSLHLLPIAVDTCDPAPSSQSIGHPKNRKVYVMQHSQQRRLAAILAADIAGYSALMGSDEEATVRDLKDHQSVVLPMIGTHGGRVIDIAGDGILAEFASVLNAVRCAVAIQRAMAERNTAIEPARRIQFRIGVNLGDVIFDDARIYGDGINIAARLESIAEPGGICISDKVHQEVRGKLDVAIRDIGLQLLKNIADPVPAYQIMVGNGRADPVTRRHAPEAIERWLPDKPSIAVLPFTNMSGDPDQEFFGDGLAEDILTELSKLRWLFVIARNSSFTYRGKTIDVRQVGRDLRVRYVLEGSVRRSGNRVRVTGQLIDAVIGSHVWAEKYDRSLSDIFAVQDEITLAVSDAIAPAIVAAEQQRAVRKLPDSLDAWEAYHRGIWHLSKQTKEDCAVSRQFFQTAIDLDPYFSSAHTAMGWAYMNGAASFAERSIEEAVAMAEPLARTAISLDDNDANARARLANILFFKGDRAAAIQEADGALQIDYQCSEALGVKGHVLIFDGRPGEGRLAIERCLEASPRAPTAHVRTTQIAMSYYFEGNYGRAAHKAQEVLRQVPNFPLALRWLAAALGQLNRTDEARATLLKLLEVSPQSFDTYVRKKQAYIRQIDHEHMLDGLRKAGWRT